MDTHHIEPMLRDGLRATLDAEHGPHPVWVGSPAAGRVAERQGTRSPLRAIAAAAAVLVVATGAAQLLQGGLQSGGAAATPSASPALLARGDFAIVDGGYEVELEAIGQGSSVTGRMIVSEPVPQQGIDTVFTVELQCTRTTEDGVIMIGGVTTEENLVAPEGTWAAIALMPGSPAKARILSQRGGPSSEATSCLAYLDEKRPVRGGWIGLVPIEGTLELGANSAAPSETPASADPSSSGNGSLPVGPHVMSGRLHGEDRVTVTVPAAGWFAPDDGSVAKDLGDGDRVTVVTVPGDYYTMPRDICDWQIDDADLRGNYWPSTADEFMAHLAEQTYDTPDGASTRDFSAPEDITVDGSHGQRIRYAYPDSDVDACDEQRFCILQDRDSWGCLLSHQEPGSLDTIWVVDPPANRNYLLVVAASGSPGPALRDEVDTLVNSMTFYVE